MPLHRSLIFWCGALVFAFLLWVWADSMKWMAAVTSNFTGPPNQLQMISEGGSVGLIVGEVDPHFTLAFSSARIRSSASLSGENPSIWGPLPAWDVNAAFGFRYGHVPYWLIVACFLPPWLGLSVWRARRIASGLIRRREMMK